MTVTMDACGQEKKTGGRGKDSFRLVTYFKYTLTSLNKSSNNKGTACKHPPHSGHLNLGVLGTLGMEEKRQPTPGQSSWDCWVIIYT